LENKFTQNSQDTKPTTLWKNVTNNTHCDEREIVAKAHWTNVTTMMMKRLWRINGAGGGSDAEQRRRR
jgi:hypothetical protein